MKEQDQNFGDDLTVEIDEGCVTGDLLGDSSFGECRDFENEQVGLGLAVPLGLDQSVREPARLDDLGLEGLPGLDVANSAQAKDRIAVVLDQPFAASVVFLQRETSAEAC
jgi:hypothetical protein